MAMTFDLYESLRDIEFNLRTILTILPIGSKSRNRCMEVPYSPGLKTFSNVLLCSSNSVNHFELQQ
jgi:hypothetical protein